MRACARAGVAVLVLDRPNPLGGDPSRIEGRRQSRACCSFVGLKLIPVRHSLTLGEIVAWRADAEDVPGELPGVVSVAGLERDEHATAWDRPFVAPSPNMPSYDTALVYPGACLLEGTNLSEGRGTTRPLRGRRGAVDRQREARRRPPRARAAWDARPPSHVSAWFSEARGQDLRGRPDPRDRSRGVSTRGDLPGPHHAGALAVGGSLRIPHGEVRVPTTTSEGVEHADRRLGGARSASVRGRLAPAGRGRHRFRGRRRSSRRARGDGGGTSAEGLSAELSERRPHPSKRLLPSAHQRNRRVDSRVFRDERATAARSGRCSMCEEARVASSTPSGFLRFSCSKWPPPKKN